MQYIAGVLTFSATDLAGHLDCRYLTGLDIEVAKGNRAKPKIWDPVLELLAERGALHEKSYIEHLRASGIEVTIVAGRDIDSNSVDQTAAAMRAGAPVIVQGALEANGWRGRADILRRVEKPSNLGAWS